MFNFSIDWMETPYFLAKFQTVSPLFTLTVVLALATWDEPNKRPIAPIVPAKNALVFFFKTLFTPKIISIPYDLMSTLYMSSVASRC